MKAIWEVITVLGKLILEWINWRKETKPQREGDKIRNDVAKGDENAVNQDISDALRR